MNKRAIEEIEKRLSELEEIEASTWLGPWRWSICDGYGGGYLEPSTCEDGAGDLLDGLIGYESEKEREENDGRSVIQAYLGAIAAPFNQTNLLFITEAREAVPWLCRTLREALEHIRSLEDTRDDLLRKLHGKLEEEKG